MRIGIAYTACPSCKWIILKDIGEDEENATSSLLNI